MRTLLSYLVTVLMETNGFLPMSLLQMDPFMIYSTVSFIPFEQAAGLQLKILVRLSPVTNCWVLFSFIF